MIQYGGLKMCPQSLRHSSTQVCVLHAWNYRLWPIAYSRSYKILSKAGLNNQPAPALLTGILALEAFSPCACSGHTAVIAPALFDHNHVRNSEPGWLKSNTSWILGPQNLWQGIKLCCLNSLNFEAIYYVARTNWNSHFTIVSVLG